MAVNVDRLLSTAHNESIQSTKSTRAKNDGCVQPSEIGSRLPRLSGKRFHETLMIEGQRLWDRAIFWRQDSWSESG